VPLPHIRPPAGIPTATPSDQYQPWPHPQSAGDARPSAAASTAASSSQLPAPAPAVAVSAFGDSVLLGAAPSLQQRFSDVTVDATEGRQANDVLDDVAAAESAGTLAPDVVIDVGNNGVISPAQLRAVLRQLADRQHVLLFTVRVPREWQDPNNATIDAVASSFANVTVIDWHTISANHPEWLYGDGIHLTPEGQDAYTGLVADALKSG
jgi:lysophospholipase L1-like esterase